MRNVCGWGQNSRLALWALAALRSVRERECRSCGPLMAADYGADTSDA